MNASRLCFREICIESLSFLGQTISEDSFLEAKHIPLLETWLTDVETSRGYIRSSGMPTSCLPSHGHCKPNNCAFPQHRRATTVEI